MEEINMRDDVSLLQQAERMRPLTEEELKARLFAQYPAMRNMTKEEIAAVIGDGATNAANSAHDGH